MSDAMKSRAVQTPSPPKLGHDRVRSIITDMIELVNTDLKAVDTGDNPEDRFDLAQATDDKAELIDVTEITNLFTTAEYTGSTPGTNPVVEYWGVDADGAMALIKSVEYDLAAGTTYTRDGGTTEELALSEATQQVDCSAFRYVLPHRKVAGDTATTITLKMKGA